MGFRVRETALSLSPDDLSLHYALGFVYGRKGHRYAVEAVPHLPDDVVMVYADREHGANLAHLTGFDPRFEEAVLFVRPQGVPRLITGNECVGMAKAAPLPMDVELWQDLSLPGQPRDRSRPLPGQHTKYADRFHSGRQTGRRFCA